MVYFIIFEEAQYAFAKISDEWGGVAGLVGDAADCAVSIADSGNQRHERPRRFLGSGYIVNDKLKLYVIINHLVIR